VLHAFRWKETENSLSYAFKTVFNITLIKALKSFKERIFQLRLQIQEEIFIMFREIIIAGCDNWMGSINRIYDQRIEH